MFYIDTDNIVGIIGLRNVITGDWVNDATVTGILYELPALHPDAAAVVDKGAGNVGIPCTAHGLSTGDSIRLERFENYNGVYIIQGITANEIVITATYEVETLTGEEFVYSAIEGTADTPIEFTYEDGSDGNYHGKIPSADAPLLQGESYMLCIKEVSGSEVALAKVIYQAGYQGL